MKSIICIAVGKALICSSVSVIGLPVITHLGFRFVKASWMSSFLSYIHNETKIFIIIYGIALGMEFLHSHNILHRELRTENICFDSFLFPKISCFYRSQNIDLPTNDQILQESIVKIMAPEFIRDNKTYNRTKPIDVYSFSIVLYEIITYDESYPKQNI